MEFRELKAEDVSSLLALYAQLDENNKNTEAQKLKAAWQQIENDSKITCYGALTTEKSLLRAALLYCRTLPPRAVRCALSKTS